jgi:hypothetical protein
MDHDEMLNIEFVQTLDANVYNVLKTVARARGVSVQELLRTVVVPDWMLLVSRSSRRRVSNGSN